MVAKRARMTFVASVVRVGLLSGVAALAAACSGSGSNDTEPVENDRFAELDAFIAERVEEDRIDGLGFSLYDARGELVFQRVYGDFAPDRRVAVASASKLVTGLLLFEVIERGLLSLESTAGEVLGWSGDKAAIELVHLLSFTSGLEPEHGCLLDVGATLGDCVDEIAATAPRAAPGERFDYGGTHLQVAARMAEVVTDQSINQLFREYLGDPLELDAEVRFYTLPRRALGDDNPLVAGGLRASMDDYAKLLRLAFARGSYGGLELGAPALFDAQSTEPFPDATIGTSPFAQMGLPFHYGLTAWLECEPPAEDCAVLSSPGAFGFTPWWDRATGYFAVIGMEETTDGGGVAPFSVLLAQDLKPLIAGALGG